MEEFEFEWLLLFGADEEEEEEELPPDDLCLPNSGIFRLKAQKPAGRPLAESLILSDLPLIPLIIWPTFTCCFNYLLLLQIGSIWIWVQMSLMS